MQFIRDYIITIIIIIIRKDQDGISSKTRRNMSLKQAFGKMWNAHIFNSFYMYISYMEGLFHHFIGEKTIKKRRFM